MAYFMAGFYKGLLGQTETFLHNCDFAQARSIVIHGNIDEVVVLLSQHTTEGMIKGLSLLFSIMADKTPDVLKC